MPETAPEAPRSYEEFRHRLAERHERLSPRLKEVAEFALAHPEEVALEKVAQLARRAGVPPSALVRFAQALGFEGFGDLQRLFKERLVTRLPAYAERIRRLERSEEVRRPLPEAFARQVGRALKRLEEEGLREAFEEAVARLAGAETLHLVAQRRSFAVAAYLAYALTHLGLRCHLLDGVGGLLLQQAAAMRRGDVLFAVSFRPYAAETLEVAAEAVRLEVPIVALTDSPLSPLARLAGSAMVVEEAELQGVRGLAVSMALASALVLALGRRLVGGGRSLGAGVEDGARSGQGG